MVNNIIWKRFWINLALVPVLLYPVWLIGGSPLWIRDSGGIIGAFVFLLIVLMPLMFVGGLIFNLILVLMPPQLTISFFRLWIFVLSWIIPLTVLTLGTQGRLFLDFHPFSPIITAVALAVYVAAIRLPVRKDATNT